MSKVKIKFSPDRSDIVYLFKTHCEQGWSPRLFIPKLKGGAAAYYFLLKANTEFRDIADFYSQKENANVSLYNKESHEPFKLN